MHITDHSYDAQNESEEDTDASDEKKVPDELYMPTRKMTSAHWEVLAANDWIWPYPLLVPDGIRDRARFLGKHYKGKYCWATCFDPYFVASLMAEGFLPMAEEAHGGPFRYLLIPKLHHQRCVLRFGDLHIARTVRKRSKRFDVTCNACFDQVVEGCLRQHGENWLLAPIVEAFRSIHRAGGVCGVRVHSFEVWIAEGLEPPPAPAPPQARAGAPSAPAPAPAAATTLPEGARLVAGEIGYSVGACYTSLSGFSLVDSSGSVQLVAAALLLRLAGAEAWDLGMALPYKVALGAVRVSRPRFLRDLARMRARPPLALPRGRVNVQRLIRLADAPAPPAAAPDAAVSPPAAPGPGECPGAQREAGPGGATAS
jgi:Leu/Phe-tRNA-protein transferase